MISDLLKWVAPGFVTVLGGTVAAMLLTAPSMVAGLEREARSALAAVGADWAEVSLASRDARLQGTTESLARRDSGIAALAAVPGMGAIVQDVTVAPLADPYRLEVRVSDGRVVVEGNVPNAEIARELAARPDISETDLSINAGHPDRRAWQSGVDFAIAHAPLLAEGSLALTGLGLDLKGVAASQMALGTLEAALQSTPAGIELKTNAVQPARATPYVWTAEFDGARIAVSGFVPSEAAVERLRMADIGAIPLATGLALASGAPLAFEDRAEVLLEQLSRLEHGRASIIDGISRLTGAPPSVEVAQAVTEALTGAGSIVQLDPPRIADYWLSVTRQPGGVLVFDGYAPDSQTRDDFALRAGADVSWLKLGSGAPTGYHVGADFGLALLDHLQEGRFTLRGNVVTLSGTASSPSDYMRLRANLDGSVPVGLVVAMAELKAPPVARYRFTVTRQSNGNTLLSGYLPDPEAEARLLAMAGTQASSTITYASGNPQDFVASAEQAMRFLPWLSVGEIAYDGTSWSISGQPGTAIDQAAIEAEFTVRNLSGSGWSLALNQPSVSAPEVADPYVFSAEKTADGRVVLTGFVPAAALKSYLAVRIGSAGSDGTEIAEGAPEGFAGAVRAAMDMLLALETGTVAFDGVEWSVRGATSDDAAYGAAEAGLTAAAGTPVVSDVTRPAPAEPYVFAARKTEEGGLVLTGSVPAESVRSFLPVRAGAPLDDQTILRPDAPAGFADDLLIAMDLLALVVEGEAEFDGAAWSVSGRALATDFAARASERLGAASPRWTLEVDIPAAAPEASASAPEPVPVEPVPAEAPYRLAISLGSDGRFVMAGDVPAEATARYLASATGADPSGLVVTEGAPETFLVDLRIGLEALRFLASGRLSFDDGAWSLSGEAIDAQARDRALSLLPATTSERWSSAVTIPQNLVLCAQQVADLSGQNAILFQSGAALIAAGAEPALDAFAAALALCPEAEVHVEGHTDADGDAQQNLALSVARAEAVIDALILRGVDPSRLYAIGYGESAPVASNETSEGKRQNRRIVVTVSDPRAN